MPKKHSKVLTDSCIPLNIVLYSFTGIIKMSNKQNSNVTINVFVYIIDLFYFI